jgi:hypothetical protein
MAITTAIINIRAGESAATGKPSTLLASHAR